MKSKKSRSRIINEMNAVMNGLYDHKIISAKELTDFQQISKIKKAPLNPRILPHKDKI